MSSGYEYLNPMTRTVIDFTNALYYEDNIDLIRKEEMRDLLSSGQLISKAWLVEKFAEHLFFERTNLFDRVLVCGGWVGFLAQLINNSFSTLEADSIDISEESTRIAKGVMVGGNAILGDMYAVDYTPYSVIVNTSAEHIPDVPAWSNGIPQGKFVVVQSNDARHIEEHISCVDSAEELAEKLQLSEVYFAGSQKFNMYTRFMVIGKK
jgi:hypothetical protein